MAQCVKGLLFDARSIVWDGSVYMHWLVTGKCKKCKKKDCLLSEENIGELQEEPQELTMEDWINENTIG